MLRRTRSRRRRLPRSGLSRRRPVFRAGGECAIRLRTICRSWRGFVRFRSRPIRFGTIRSWLCTISRWRRCRTIVWLGCGRPVCLRTIRSWFWTISRLSGSRPIIRLCRGRAIVRLRWRWCCSRPIWFSRTFVGRGTVGGSSGLTRSGYVRRMAGGRRRRFSSGRYFDHGMRCRRRTQRLHLASRNGLAGMRGQRLLLFGKGTGGGGGVFLAMT